jgi:hypothetical protein
VAQDLGSFHRLVLYVTMVSRDDQTFLGHVATSTSTRIDKTSPLRHPRRPSLLLYKRAGRGSTRGQAEAQAKQRQKNNKPQTTKNQSLLYSHFPSETWARFPLSQLVTPTQALRYKEIQYSPLPAGRRAFFCPNQDKSLCILLASPSRLGTRNT